MPLIGKAKVLTGPILNRVSPVKSIKKPEEDGLPMEDTDGVGVVNPSSLRWLFITPPGFGKTELGMSFPDALLLACEEGHKFVRGRKIIIDCFDYKSKVLDPWQDEGKNWHMSFIQAVERIETSGRYKTVIVDTVDALVKMVTDFSELKHRVDHVEDIGDYGKGFDLGQNKPFRQAMNRILKSGRGIIYTTHQKANTVTIKGKPQTKKETTLPQGVANHIIPQVDIVLHGRFGKRRMPNKFRDRIIITEGSEEAIAKNRGGILPPKFILPFDKRWETIQEFFKDPESVKKATANYYKHYTETTNG